MFTALLALTVTIHGQAVTLPPIGTPAYSASCVITRAAEDDVRAFCPEDGVTYRYDFDGQPEMARFPHRFPDRAAGWVVSEDAR